MEQVEQLPRWISLVENVTLKYLANSNGRSPFSQKTRLRFRFVPRWLRLFCPDKKRDFFDASMCPRFAQFAGLPVLVACILLLKVGAIVAAPLHDATSNITESKDKGPNHNTPFSKMSTQWQFCMNCHIDHDAELTLRHTVRSTSGNGSDLSEGSVQQRGQEFIFVAMRVTGEVKTSARSPN